jgi:moderate conductance mechanosensitive channel
MDFEFLFSLVWTQILIIVISALVLQWLAGHFITGIVGRLIRKHKEETQSDRKKRRDTVAGIFKATSGLIIWLTAIGFVMYVLDINLASVAAGAGFLGIIIGLGAQATIRDYLAGIFILAENQYRVGDIVTLNGGGVSMETSGVVEDITLRITRLRDLDGTMHIIRNGEASIITNRTFKYSTVLVDIGVAYESDLDLVEKVINKVGKDMIKDPEISAITKEPIHFFRVDAFADSAIIIKALGQVSPAEQWRLAGEFRRRIVTAFRENDITIAYPQVVVHQPSKK